MKNKLKEKYIKFFIFNLIKYIKRNILEIIIILIFYSFIGILFYKKLNEIIVYVSTNKQTLVNIIKLAFPSLNLLGFIFYISILPIYKTLDSKFILLYSKNPWKLYYLKILKEFFSRIYILIIINIYFVPLYNAIYLFSYKLIFINILANLLSYFLMFLIIMRIKINKIINNKKIFSNIILGFSIIVDLFLISYNTYLLITFNIFIILMLLKNYEKIMFNGIIYIYKFLSYKSTSFKRKLSSKINPIVHEFINIRCRNNKSLIHFLIYIILFILNIFLYFNNYTQALFLIFNYLLAIIKISILSETFEFMNWKFYKYTNTNFKLIIFKEIILLNLFFLIFEIINISFFIMKFNLIQTLVYFITNVFLIPIFIWSISIYYNYIKKRIIYPIILALYSFVNIILIRYCYMIFLVNFILTILSFYFSKNKYKEYEL